MNLEEREPLRAHPVHDGAAGTGHASAHNAPLAAHAFEGSLLEDRDALLQAIGGRLRAIVSQHESSQHHLVFQAQVLECAEALEQLHDLGVPLTGPGAAL